MAAVGQIYFLRLRGRMEGQISQNTFVYDVSEAGVPANVTALDLEIAFHTTIVPLLTALQSVAFTYEEIYCYNYSVLTDFTVDTISDIGVVAGDAMPSYVAYGLSYNPVVRTDRPGAKRIGGVPEANVQDGVLVVGAEAAMTALVDALSAQLTVGIAGKVDPGYLHIPTDTFPYPNFSGTNGVNYKRITTQNSRKIGRGI